MICAGCGKEKKVPLCPRCHVELMGKPQSWEGDNENRNRCERHVEVKRGSSSQHVGNGQDNRLK